MESHKIPWFQTTNQQFLVYFPNDFPMVSARRLGQLIAPQLEVLHPKVATPEG